MPPPPPPPICNCFLRACLRPWLKGVDSIFSIQANRKIYPTQLSIHPHFSVYVMCIKKFQKTQRHMLTSFPHYDDITLRTRVWHPIHSMHRRRIFFGLQKHRTGGSRGDTPVAIGFLKKICTDPLEKGGQKYSLWNTLMTKKIKKTLSGPTIPHPLTEFFWIHACISKVW